MRKTVNEASARPRKKIPSARARLGTSGEFANAFGGMDIAERFFDAVTLAAEQSGCKILFEIPALLLDRTADRAAAVSCGQGSDVFFIGFNAANGSVMVVAASEAPADVIDFTRSYAGVLGMIASDRNLVAPLLQ